MGRAAVVYNPVSGAGRAETLSAEAVACLEKQGLSVQRIATRPGSGALEVVRELASGLDLVVVAGGDGTIREVIEGLGPDVGFLQLAVIPLGNANVVARELGIPTEPRAALRLLIDGTSTRVDLGYANGAPFLAMASAGWDAATLRWMARIRARRSGRWLYRFVPDLLYVLTGLAAYLQDRGRGSCRLLLRCDGQARARVYRGAVIANFRSYAKGWSMAPRAHFQSGTLHYQARRLGYLPAMIWHLMAAMLVRHSPRFISDYGDADTIRIESERPFPLQLDGDFRGLETRVELRVEPAALSVLVPLAAHAPLQTAKAARLSEIGRVAVAPQ